MNLAFLLAQRVKYWREKYKGRRWMLRSVSTGRKPPGYGGGQCPGTGVAGGSMQEFTPVFNGTADKILLLLTEGQ